VCHKKPNGDEGAALRWIQLVELNSADESAENAQKVARGTWRGVIQVTRSGVRRWCCSPGCNYFLRRPHMGTCRLGKADGSGAAELGFSAMGFRMGNGVIQIK